MKDANTASLEMKRTLLQNLCRYVPELRKSWRRLVRRGSCSSGSSSYVVSNNDERANGIWKGYG